MSQDSPLVGPREGWVKAGAAPAYRHTVNPMAYNWCFTSFEADEPEFDDATMLYLCYQQEKCPETGRLHWQGYVELVNNTRKFSVEAMLGGAGVNASKRKTSAINARDYCKKQETKAGEFKEFGTISTDRRAERVAMEGGAAPAKAVSLQAQMVTDIQGGASLRTIIEKYPQQYMRNCNGIKQLIYQFKCANGSIDTPKEVYVFWGPTRTGKTRAVTEELTRINDGVAYWLKPAKNGQLWFDGYDGEDIIVIDDFEGNMNIEDFLHLTDRYAGRQNWQIKGGYVKLFHSKIFFTSNSHPSKWFDTQPLVKQQAVMARLSSIHHLSGRPIDMAIHRAVQPVVKEELVPYTPLARHRALVPPPIPRQSGRSVNFDDIVMSRVLFPDILSSGTEDEEDVIELD